MSKSLLFLVTNWYVNVGEMVQHLFAWNSFKEENVYLINICLLIATKHQQGHWKLGHTLTNFVVTQVYFGAAFYIFSLCYTSKDLCAAFGFDDPGQASAPTIVALMLFFQTLWAPVDKVLSFVLTVFSRHCEFAADEFSVDLGYNQKLQSGLVKIHLENLGASKLSLLLRRSQNEID